MNTLTGTVTGYPNKLSGEEINLSYSIPPAGSLLLFIPNVKIPRLFNTCPTPQDFVAVQSTSSLKVARNEDNALMIDFCDIEVGKESIKDLNTYYAADKVFKYYGFKNGNPWNTSVQFRKEYC